MSIPLPMLYDWQVVNSRGEILVEGAENKARAFTAIPELSLAPHLFMNRRLRRCAPTLNVLATEHFLSGIGFLPFCTFTMGLKRLLVCVSCSASRRQLHPGGPCLLGSCLSPEFGFLQAQTAHLKDHLKIRIHPTPSFFPLTH